MKNLTWQNPGQLFVAQELIKIVKLKCCGIKVLLIVNCAYSYFHNWNNIFYSKNMDIEGNIRIYEVMRIIIPIGEVYLTTPSLGSKIFIVNVVSGVPCYIWPGPPSTSTGTLENLNRIKRINDWDCLSFEEKIVRARELGINYILFQTSEIPSNVNRVIQSEEFALVNVKLEPNYFD